MSKLGALFWIALSFWISSLIISGVYLVEYPFESPCYVDDQERLICDMETDVNTTYQEIASLVFLSALISWLIPVWIFSRKS